MEETKEPKKEEHQAAYNKRPMWQWVVIYIVIGGLIYGAFYYFMSAKNGSSMYSETTNTQDNINDNIEPTSSMEGAEEITVEGNEFAFTPSTITVKEGVPVKLTFKNTGKYPHNFTVSDLSVQTATVQSGQEDTITFTPTKTGSFEYICTVPTHLDKGMKGTLTVE